MKKFIILHHSLTARDKTSFEAVDRYHERKWDFESALGHFIGYHYFIDGRGKVTQGRADDERGAHCRQEDMNAKSVGICLAGDFDHERPSVRQLIALKTLLRKLMRKHGIPLANLKYHRDYAKYKSCPGRNILNDFFARLIGDNYFVRLERAAGEERVWAVDYQDNKFQIENLAVLRKGVEIGLWSGKIRPDA